MPTEQGAAKAKDAQATVLAAMAKGARSRRAQGPRRAVPPAQPIGITREQLAAMQQSAAVPRRSSCSSPWPRARPSRSKRPTRPVYIVSLKSVTRHDPGRRSVPAQAGSELGQSTGRELAEMRSAIRKRASPATKPPSARPRLSAGGQ
jgi:peptidyl-prolyl cis-trans isomerase D